MPGMKLALALRIHHKEGYAMLKKKLALRRFHTVDIRVAEAGAGTLA